MGLPMLKSFLYCMTVRTGALVLGWLQMIHSSMSVLNIFALYVNFFSLSEKDRIDILKGAVDYSRTRNTYTLHQPYGLLNESYEQVYSGSDGQIPDETYKQVNETLLTILIIISLLIVSKFLIDLFYLIGAYKEKPCYMLPSIILSALGTLFTLTVCAGFSFFTVVLMIQKISSPSSYSGSQVAISVLGSLLFCLCAFVVTYTFLIMFTFYRTTKMQKQEPKNILYAKM